MKPTGFSVHVTNFLTHYLAAQRNLSPNGGRPPHLPHPAATCGSAVRLDVVRRQAGAAGVPAAPACWPRELADDDACGHSAGGQREATQPGQAAAADGERADGAGRALIDIQDAAVRAQPGVDRADPVTAADRGAAQQGQRAVSSDPVAGDRAGPGVHGEQVPAVMGDLHPARGDLVVREGGGPDR